MYIFSVYCLSEICIIDTKKKLLEKHMDIINFPVDRKKELETNPFKVPICTTYSFYGASNVLCKTKPSFFRVCLDWQVNLEGLYGLQRK